MRIRNLTAFLTPILLLLGLTLASPASAQDKTIPVAVIFGEGSTIGLEILISPAEQFESPERFFLHLRLREVRDNGDVLFMAQQRVELADVELIGDPIDGFQTSQVAWITPSINAGSGVEACVKSFRRDGRRVKRLGKVCERFTPETP